MSHGPGDPACKDCGGRGVILFGNKNRAGQHPPSYQRCPCVLQKDILANVERGMRGLSLAPSIEKSVVARFADDDLWVTATKGWFTAHLRHLAIRMPPTWYFKVVSDADLMTAWLASAAIKGKDILDPDAAKMSLTHLTLLDLVKPPGLLVIRLGIKAARNVASPEVLQEALQLREHEGLPTWVWDTPDQELAEGHICYSASVGDFLSPWPHLRPAGSPPPRRSTSGHQDMDLPTSPKPSGPRTMSRGKK